jgi:signal peptidase I
MKRIFQYLVAISMVLLVGFLSVSCEKSAGEGGNATITGSVWVKDYNSTFTSLQSEYAGVKEDVYIVYGDNVGYDDRVETDYLGYYRFNYLRPGKYTIYVFSKDSTLTSPDGKTAIIKEVEIVESDQVLAVPQIIIYN